MTTSTEQQWHDACARAREQSKRDECTLHVSACCAVVDGCPVIVAFTIGDWYTDGSTLTTFTNGREH